MASEITLTDKQRKMLRDIVSYWQKNRLYINDAIGDDYSEADIEELQAALGGGNPKEKVATLSLQVTYNPTMTNPEELCNALDTLLEIALSTQGIMDEYGDFVIDPFQIQTGKT